MDRREETRAVKAALKKAGITASVGHGKGTAWGWLHIRPNNYQGHIFGVSRQIIKIAQEVTGRHGEYDGCINVY